VSRPMLSHVAPAKQRLISHCVIDLLDMRDLHFGLPDTAIEIHCWACVICWLSTPSAESSFRRVRRWQYHVMAP